jgi:hypothetical protein
MNNIETDRTDLSLASLTSSPLRFSNNSPPASPITDPTFTAASLFQKSIFGEPLWVQPSPTQTPQLPSLDDLFIDLRHLSNLKTSKKIPVQTLPNHTSYSDQVYNLLHSLQFLSTSTNLLTPIEEGSSLAAQIYIHTILCSMSLTSRAVETALHKLYICSEKLATINPLPLGFKKASEYRTSFWFLTVAWVASAGVESRHRHAIVGILRVLCGWIHCESVADREQLLNRILWDGKWNAFLPQLWRELEC